MRHISNHVGSVNDAVEQERARRALLRAEDVDAEVAKFKADTIDAHLQALVELATDNPGRRAATKLAAIKMADELAGPQATAVMKQVAMSIVLFSMESDLASEWLLRMAAKYVPTVALLKWRASAELHMNAKIKTLALIRDMEASDLASKLRRLRIADTG
jgi:hypothetical protein